MFIYEDWYWKVDNKYWSSKRKIWLDLPDEEMLITLEDQIPTIIVNEYELNQLFYERNLWELAPNPYPQVIPAWKGKCILAEMGYYDGVVAYIETSASQSEKLAFYNAPNWYRNSTFINEMGNMLNLTEQQIDIMFKNANDIAV